jgi:hypothetical protein
MCHVPKEPILVFKEPYVGMKADLKLKVYAL